MAVSTQPKQIEDFLLYEQPDRMSREHGTVLSGSVLDVGQVVGKDYKAIISFTQVSGTNLTEGDVSLAGQAKQGTYTIYGTGVDTGYIVDPDGYRVDDFSAIPYTGNHLNIGSGSVADTDEYTVDVAANPADGKYVPLDPSAVNGAHEVHGISLGAYDATDGDIPGVFIEKQAVVVTGGLVWPDAITTAQKDQALKELDAVGIKVRDAA